MAIIKCPSCHQSVSEFAETCRHCNSLISPRPVVKSALSASSVFFKRIGLVGWFVLIVFSSIIYQCSTSNIRRNESDTTAAHSVVAPVKSNDPSYTSVNLISLHNGEQLAIGDTHDKFSGLVSGVEIFNQTSWSDPNMPGSMVVRKFVHLDGRKRFVVNFARSSSDGPYRVVEIAEEQ